MFIWLCTHRASVAKGAVVGRQGAALATFVGAFYAAQMRMSTGVQGAYRFSCPSASMRAAGALYQGLNAGELPGAAEVSGLGDVTFLMDYPDTLSKRFMPFGKAKAERGQPELELTVVPLVAGANEGSLAPDGAGWAALVGCRVLVVVGALASVTDPAKGAELSDPAVARLFAEAPEPKPRPVFVFQLPGEPPLPKPVKEGEDPQPLIPPTNEGAARAKLGTAHAAALFPRTQGELVRARADASHFFSWVAVDRDKAGMPRAKRRRLLDAGGIEPDYPFAELEALVWHLGKLAV